MPDCLVPYHTVTGNHMDIYLGTVGEDTLVTWYGQWPLGPPWDRLQTYMWGHKSDIVSNNPTTTRRSAVACLLSRQLSSHLMSRLLYHMSPWLTDLWPHA
jgi:hypothetical protein